MSCIYCTSNDYQKYSFSFFMNHLQSTYYALDAWGQGREQDGCDLHGYRLYCLVLDIVFKIKSVLIIFLPQKMFEMLQNTHLLFTGIIKKVWCRSASWGAIFFLLLHRMSEWRTLQTHQSFPLVIHVAQCTHNSPL